MLKNGKNKPINYQVKLLKEILLGSTKMRNILEIMSSSGINDYYVAAGAVNQTVFNYYHGYDPDYGIDDVDIVYYDKNTGYEAEDVMIKRINKLLNVVDVKTDIKNQARVHLWYEKRFGHPVMPNTSAEDAIRKWGTTVTCIGVRLENNNLIVYAPYGLNDLFELVLRPVKINMTKKQFDEKVIKWKEKWPLLKVISWDN